MRLLVLTAWLLLPLGVYVWHMGPGQKHQAVDRAGQLIRLAQDYVQKGEHAQAVEAYGEALQLLPTDRVADARKLRLERAKSQMLSKQLAEAHGDLLQLVEDMQADPQTDASLLREVRSTTANAKYYLTWLMRLEGQGREDWEPEIDSSRAMYKLLAEQAQERGDQSAAKKHREDLEAAIRLARMDLGELQGLPLPSQ